MQAGDFYLRVNQFDEALRQYEEGIRKDPDRKITYLKHEVELYVRSNRMQNATAKNEEILKLDPKDPESRGLKATMSLEKGDYALATSELQSVVSARPQNYVAHFNLGRAFLAKNDLEQARQEFDKAVGLRPDYTLWRGSRKHRSHYCEATSRRRFETRTTCCESSPTASREK